MKKKNLLFDLIFYVLFVGIVGLLIYRNRFGFGNLDESFYITIPYRLWQGDVLFADEWHVSMMNGYLLWPIMCIYQLFFNGTESIVVNFRHIYTIVLAIISVVIYHRLKKVSYYGACFAAIAFMLYAPYNMTALSYNTMGIMFLTLAGVLLGTNLNKNKIISYLAGTFYSFSVLCCPYLVLVFVIYTIYSLIKKSEIKETYLYVLYGIITQAVLFLLFILSRTTITQIIKSFPLIMSDPEYAPMSLFNIFFGYFLSITNTNSFKMICACALMLILTLIDKNKTRRDLYFIGTVGAILLMLYVNYQRNNYINMLMFPLAFLAPICLFRKNEYFKQLFKYLWIPGMIYTFVINVSSDQSFYVITSMGTVPMVASIVMGFASINEMENKYVKSLSIVSISSLLLLQIGTEAVLRWNDVYWETGLKTQNVLIEDGPEKGLYVSKEKYDMYYSDMNDIQSFNFKGNSICYLTHKCWYYLFNDGKYINAAYSAWLSRNPIRLIDYYEINPKKIPDNIYSEPEYFEIVDKLSEKYNYSCETTEIGNIACSLNK